MDNQTRTPKDSCKGSPEASVILTQAAVSAAVASTSVSSECANYLGEQA